MMARYAIAAAAAFLVMAWFSARSSLIEKGIHQEKVRVEEAGNRAHAKSAAARKTVEKKKPSEINAALRAYCRDC